jgi:hypothetical protein
LFFEKNKDYDQGPAEMSEEQSNTVSMERLEEEIRMLRAQVEAATEPAAPHVPLAPEAPAIPRYAVLTQDALEMMMRRVYEDAQRPRGTDGEGQVEKAKRETRKEIRARLLSQLVKFDGKGGRQKVDAFIDALTSYFGAPGRETEDWAEDWRLITAQLNGTVCREWIQRMVADDKVPGNMEEFATAMRAEFYPSNQKLNAKDRLKALTLGRSMNDHIQKFNAIRSTLATLPNAPTIDEDTLVQYFIRGIERNKAIGKTLADRIVISQAEYVTNQRMSGLEEHEVKYELIRAQTHAKSIWAAMGLSELRNRKDGDGSDEDDGDEERSRRKKQKKGKEAQVSAAQGTRDKKAKKTKSPRSEITCHRCGKQGHIARYCTEDRPKEQASAEGGTKKADFQKKD